MPLYICRWPNGDSSFVSATSKEAAVEALDEVDNAEGCPLSVLKDFMVHFRLAEDGTFDFEGFGEATEEALRQAYPILDQTVDQILEDDPGFELQGSRTPEQEQMIENAVEAEQERVRPKPVKQPQTRLGQDIKRAMDAPTSMIDREIGEKTAERLKNFKGEGKPN